MRYDAEREGGGRGGRDRTEGLAVSVNTGWCEV